MPRPYTISTVKPLKGLRTNSSRNTLEKGEFSTLENFHVNHKGYLEKRRGIWRASAVKPAGNTGLRLLDITRAISGGEHIAFAWVTDGVNIWKSNSGSPIGTGSWVNYAAGTPSPLTGQFEWIFQAGGTAEPFNIQGVRRNAETFGINPITNGTGLGGGPQGTFCIGYKSRMWVFNTMNTSGLENRLYFSAANNNFGTWSTPSGGFIDIGLGDGQALVSAIVYNDVLYLFKNKSIWALDASSEDQTTYIPRNVHPSLGSAGRGSVQNIEGFLYFFSGDGVYRTDGTTFEEISEPIRNLFANLSYTSREQILKTEAVYWNNKYVLSRRTATPHLYVYDILAEAWSTWNCTMNLVPFAGMATYEEREYDYLCLGSSTMNSNSGYYYNTVGAGASLEWYYDDTIGTAGGADANLFECKAHLGSLDEDLPAETKRNYYLGLDVESTSTQDLELVDATITPTSSHIKAVPSSRRNIIRFPGAGRVKQKQLNIKATTRPGLPAGKLQIMDIISADQVRDKIHRTV